VAGAEAFVRGASRIAVLSGISPLVIGLTVVAFGTSAPEAAVSLRSGFAGQAGLALGNVIGSNIANVLFVLGLSALIAPLTVASQLLKLDVPLFITASVLVWLFGSNGIIGRLEGTFFVVAVVVYTVFLIVQSRRASTIVQETYTQEALPTPTASSTGQCLVHIGAIIVGLVGLVVGADWLVGGAVAIARAWGMSELVVGLTVVAVGTSLPEVATSIVASIRGERDIAVGNIIGSCLFNILAVLGLTAMLVPGGVSVDSAALSFDIPVMIAVSLVCLPIFFTGHLIARWEGGLFFGYYVAYLIYLVLYTTEHDSLPLYNAAMLGVVMPVTLFTLCVITWRAWRA
jgi:cation:H+ antiporter